MRIETNREGGVATLRLGGRLDRELAEHLSNAVDDLVRDGVRSLTIDLGGVTYVSSEATKALTRWQQELGMLRGEVRVTSVAPSVREMFALAGWDPAFDASGATGTRATPLALRQSSWFSGARLATAGHYQLAACVPEGTLVCRLHGDPERLARSPFQESDCAVVSFPPGTFGVGLGAIGARYSECHRLVGELVAVAGCVAHFPSDGALMADYLVAEREAPPTAVLASGLTCEGGFAKLVRFSPQSEAEPVSLSELAGVCLDAVGGKLAGLVIAGEAAGLAGARLRRAPHASGGSVVQFEVPAVRDWLAFAPERTYSMTTALIAGVVARAPQGPLAAHLRPLGERDLSGHFHAAVFSYHPLPQRTVELNDLVRGLFQARQLRDVLHLLRDDRGDAGVGESALVRGVGWVAPITEVVQ